MIDPPVIKCIFPGDPRPFDFLGMQSGRIIVVDRTTGQWMQIGIALPANIPSSRSPIRTLPPCFGPRFSQTASFQRIYGTLHGTCTENFAVTDADALPPESDF